MGLQIRHRTARGALLASGLLVASILAAPSGVAATHVVAPAPVTKVKALVTYKSVSLTWTNPKKGTFGGVVIRRATGAKAPASYKAGILVSKLPATRNSVVDTKVSVSTKYSYSLFSFQGNLYSKGVSLTVTTSATPLLGINVFANTGGYGFNYPTDVAFDGSHLWVTNYWNDTVTEMNSSNGAFVRILGNTPTNGFYFHRPQAILYADGMIWVVNPPSSSSGPVYNGWIDEINPATGALVRVLGRSSYTGDPVFNYPEAIVAVGTDIWVANNQPSSSGSLTEFVASTGVLVRNASGAQYLFDQPNAMIATGTKLWVVNPDSQSVTEVDASTGAFVQNLSGSSYGFAVPSAITSDGTDVWVANQAFSGNSVTEFAASNGAWIRTVSGGSYGFNHPDAITVVKGHVYAGNAGVINSTNGTSVTEFSASSGAWDQTLSGSSTYKFDVPSAFAFDGANLWVANQYGQSVTEFPAT